MDNTIDYRLEQLGITLPEASTPAANYVPFTLAGDLVFVSGQITVWNGKLKYTGRIGEKLSVEDGYEAARICGLNLISQLKRATHGNLNLVKKVVKLGGFVSSSSKFTDQPKVINGASDLMVEVFGEEIGIASFFQPK